MRGPARGVQVSGECTCPDGIVRVRVRFDGQSTRIGICAKCREVEKLVVMWRDARFEARLRGVDISEVLAERWVNYDDGNVQSHVIQVSP